MRALSAAVLALVLSACTASATIGADYHLYEFGIDGPTTLSRGDDAIHAINNGEFTHTLVVTDAAGEVVAASGLIPAGSSADVALDLEAGTYMLTCRIVFETDDGELVDHFEKGMHLTVSVSG